MPSQLLILLFLPRTLFELGGTSQDAAAFASLFAGGGNRPGKELCLNRDLGILLVNAGGTNLHLCQNSRI